MANVGQSQPAEDRSSKSENTPMCPYCQRHFRTQDELTFHIVTRHAQTGKSPGLEPASTGKG